VRLITARKTGVFIMGEKHGINRDSLIQKKDGKKEIAFKQPGSRKIVLEKKKVTKNHISRRGGRVDKTILRFGTRESDKLVRGGVRPSQNTA